MWHKPDEANTALRQRSVRVWRHGKKKTCRSAKLELADVISEEGDSWPFYRSLNVPKTFKLMPDASQIDRSTAMQGCATSDRGGVKKRTSYTSADRYIRLSCPRQALTPSYAGRIISTVQSSISVVAWRWPSSPRHENQDCIFFPRFQDDDSGYLWKGIIKAFSRPTTSYIYTHWLILLKSHPIHKPF